MPVLFSIFLPGTYQHDQWLCLYYENPDDGSKIDDREIKKIHTKSKGQCKDKCHKNNSYISLHNYDYETPCIDIYIDLLSINFNKFFVRTLTLCLPSDQ